MSRDEMLLATATCQDCGAVIRLTASTIPNAVDATVRRFRAAFESCTACGGELEFAKEVQCSG